MTRNLFRMHRWVALAAVVALASAFAPSPASAQSLTWQMRNYHSNVISVRFFSKSRNHVWPGRTRVWVLRDRRIKVIRLRCLPGEKVCYGAWVRGRSNIYWGVGRSGRRGCGNCCYRCNGGVTPIRNLR